MIMEGIDTDDIEVVERYQHNLQKNDFDSNDEEIAKVFWDVNLNKPPEYWDAYKFDFENGYEMRIYYISET